MKFEFKAEDCDEFIKETKPFGGHGGDYETGNLIPVMSVQRANARLKEMLNENTHVVATLRDSLKELLSVVDSMIEGDDACVFYTERNQIIEQAKAALRDSGA